MIPITTLDVNQRYWLVRTEGGRYYKNFINKSFIAIGWDKFNDIDVIKSIRNRKDEEYMVGKLRKAYPEKRRPKHDLNQMRTFVSIMTHGDIVIIPSTSSYNISFGQIESDAFVKNVSLSDEEEKKGICPYGKRRNVKWLKTINRDRLDPYLYRLFFSHHTISNANEYGPLIDRTLHSLFIKGDEAHIVLEVKSKEKIFARDLTDLIQGLLDFADDFNDVTGSNIDFRDIEMKVNVQSPGLIELIGYSIHAILAIAGILTVISGGKFNLKIKVLGTEVKIDTPGLIEKIIQYKERVLRDSQKQKKIVNSKKILTKLKVKIPEELLDDIEN